MKLPKDFTRFIVDRREQRSYADEFTRLGLPWAPGTLRSGDYSVAGFEDSIAVERKAISDFVSCVTTELVRLEAMPHAFVVVEADLRDIWSGLYVSRVKPQAVVASAAAWSVRHVPVFFASNASFAADLTIRLLLRSWEALTTQRGETSIALEGAAT